MDDSIAFCKNLEENVLILLNKKFINKCFKSCLIIKILDVMDISECRIIQSIGGNKCSINVRFKCEGIVYGINEVINGCNVIEISKQNIIIASTQYADIIVDADVMLSSITVGQKISVMVGMVRYYVETHKISVSAKLHVLPTDNIIYEITEEKKPDTSKIYELDKKIRNIKEIIAAPNVKTTYAFFDNLLYPFSKRTELKKKNAIDINNLDELFKIKSKYVFIDQHDITKVIPADNADNAACLNFSLENCILAILQNYYEHILNIKEMMDIYNTPEILTSHKNLWQIYHKLKKE
ncbi:MAG: RPB7/RPC8 family DNA-directed RNA polymerase subunit [Acidimicrobiales bacterium]